jgi:hypothetical protein
MNEFQNSNHSAVVSMFAVPMQCPFMKALATSFKTCSTSTSIALSCLSSRTLSEAPQSGMRVYHHHMFREWRSSSALESALVVVRAVAWDVQIQNHLEILPSYFGTMIAFASISLIKAWGNEPTMCYLDQNEVSSALDRLVEVFQACSERIQPEHPLCSFAKSLKIVMEGCCGHTREHSIDMGLMTNDIDRAMFGLDIFGNGPLGLNYLDDHNNLFPYTGQFDAGFLGLQNL